MGFFIWYRAQHLPTENIFTAPKQLTYKYLQSSFVRESCSFVLDMAVYRDGKLSFFFFLIRKTIVHSLALAKSIQ